MSRKSKRNQKPQEPPAQQESPRGGIGRKALFVTAAVAVLVAVAGGIFFYQGQSAKSAQQAAANNRELLASGDSPAVGNADAKVHIVEFLDPACETCAVFYPHVKKLMADNPGKIRLSVRHLPFHKGSEHVVRILEASRSQGKYWQTLEAVFASQGRWTMNHQAYPERVWPELAGTGLDLDRVRSEMNSAQIAARMERDFADARMLGVSQTPEYFVNGRPMPSFGLEELQALVKEELRAAYP
jgi:protein-disulfide isomerase